MGILWKNSDYIRKQAIKILKLSPVIEFEIKNHYDRPELVYVVSDHKEPLQRLTGSKTLTKNHVEALKQLGFGFKHKSIEKVFVASDFLKSLGLKIENGKFVSDKIQISTRQCPKCNGNNVYVKEMHPDTDMNEMVLYCPDCKNYLKLKTAKQGKTKIKEHTYDICPHCGEEIDEKAVFYDEKGYYGEPKTWCHRGCGGSIIYPQENLTAYSDKWLTEEQKKIKAEQIGQIFFFRVRINGSKLPEYLQCHPKCEYMSNGTCNLFKDKMVKEGDFFKRTKACISAVEGLI